MRLDFPPAFRALGRSPSSACAAILTLALALGVGTTLMALVDAALVQPPPFEDPGALLLIGEAPLTSANGSARPVTRATFDAWKTRTSTVFVGLEGFDGTNFTLTGIGAAERLSATAATPGLLPLLGVTPARGRTFDAADIEQAVVIVSDEFWRTKLAADPDVLGRPLTLGGRLYTIVGVLPHGFTFGLDPCEIWVPLSPSRLAEGTRVSAVGRLARDRTALDAMPLLSEISAQSTPPARAVVVPVASAILGPAASTIPLLVAAGAAGALAAAVNLALVMLVRTADRRHELLVRSSLGASSRQLVGEMLLETSVLTGIGAAAGLVLALWLTPAVASVAAGQLGARGVITVAINGRVVGGLIVAALCSACISALVPALHAMKLTAAQLTGRGSTARVRHQPMQSAFVIGEVAVAFVLLTSVVLVGRSLYRVLEVNPGFVGEGVYCMAVSLPRASYPDPASVGSFYSRLQSALRDRLGSDAVAIVDELPLTGDRGRGLVSTEDGRSVDAAVRVASDGYFRIMRTVVVDGREFEPRDRESRPIVVSQSLARQLFGDTRVSGRRVRLGQSQPPFVIVGVIEDVKQRALDEGDSATAYFSATQSPSPSSQIVVRSTAQAADILTIARAEVARLDPELPIYGWKTMSDVVRASPGVPARQIVAASFAGFAILALALAGVGLFGVMAHMVSSRRAELALRVALGASPTRLARAVLAQGSAMLVPGLAAGWALSLAMSGALRALMFEIGSRDAATTALVAGLVGVTGLLAVLPSARRAARSDPITVLRD
jgi:putative ABC transport system permease protein